MIGIPDSKNRTSGMKDYHVNGTNIKKSEYKPKTTLSEYLNEGKIGDREVKDKRIPLVGDLDVFEESAKIATARGSSDCYTNWVFSFIEDDISEKHLQEITQSFIDMYTVGYEKNELVIYAEAHKPKIKFKVKDGKRIKRHLHIHISFCKYSSKLDKMCDLGHHGSHISSGGRQREADLFFRWIEQKYNLQTTLKPIRNVYEKNLPLQIMREAMDAYCLKQIKDLNSFDELISNLKDYDFITTIKKSKNAKTPYIVISFANGKKIRLKGNLYSDYGFQDAKNEILEKEQIKYDPLSEPKDIPMPEELVKLQEARFDKITKDLAKKRAQVQHVDILSDLVPMPMDEKYKEWMKKKEYKSSEIVSPFTAYTENIKSEQKANINIGFYNQNLDARVLLYFLKETHNIDEEIYNAFKTKGGYKIQVGTRNYNVVDFLQKEINLDPIEIAKYVSYTHKKQQEMQNNHTNIQPQKSNIYQRMSYQNKVFIDIYHSHTSIDLSSFYISKTSDKTILRKQGISIEDIGDALQSQFTQDVKTQVELMTQIAIAKEWDLEDIEIEGTKEFKQEVLKQISEQKEKENKATKIKTRKNK